jgi:hypothetical protein
MKWTPLALALSELCHSKVTCTDGLIFGADPVKVTLTLVFVVDGPVIFGFGTTPA